ncbi:hypothetical protein KKG51_00465, partial [Patescibacteria group bacterium]|nr:hypothetical protein [Patescibacteria group bacterium]
DTVIAINQSILKELLKITGPMRIEGLRGEFTDENYDVILSYIIESKLTGKNTPKQVLKNLVPAVKEEIIKPENFVKVFQLLKNEIARKNLLAYSRHDDVEEYFDQIKASGKMIKPAANEDYLSVVTTSISGNKSDKYIEQSIDHNTWISKDGEIINQVAVTRRHTWDTNELWKWWDYLSGFGYTYISDAIKDILGRGKNTSVIRVYVPTGSILQETTSIANVERAFDNGLEKEFFVFRMEVAPGEEKKVVIDYKLPFKLNFSPFAQYKFHVQKQPGNLNTLFRKKVSGERITLQSAFPESMTQEDELMYKLKLDYDEYFASLWGK